MGLHPSSQDGVTFSTPVTAIRGDSGRGCDPMKLMCQCGRYVDYETPFNEFYTRRVACGPSTCKKYVPSARAPGPAIPSLSAGTFSEPATFPPRRVGMFAH